MIFSFYIFFTAAIIWKFSSIYKGAYGAYADGAYGYQNQFQFLRWNFTKHVAQGLSETALESQIKGSGCIPVQTMAALSPSLYRLNRQICIIGATSPIECIGNLQKVVLFEWMV